MVSSSQVVTNSNSSETAIFFSVSFRLNLGKRTNDTSSTHMVPVKYSKNISKRIRPTSMDSFISTGNFKVTQPSVVPVILALVP